MFNNSNRFLPVGISLVAALLLTVNCATSRTVTYTKSFIPRDAKPAAIPASTLKLYNNRQVKADLAQSIDELTAFVEANPGHYDAMVMLCRGHYLMADGHLYIEIAPDKSNAKAIQKEQGKHFDLGVKWCERAMATNEAFYKKVAVGGGDVVTALPDLTINEIDALYWSYANLAKWSRIEGLMTLLENKSKFTAIVARVESLNPKYFHGSVLRYKGAANLASPTGNKKEGAQQLEASIKAAPNYFGTKVLYADLGLRGDEEKAIKYLNEVINGNANAIPDIKPEQLLEQEKAKKLLAEDFN
ncbi:TRAP transporter TatT component family protein [Leptospira sp. GIMC2001]|uniref:TRAP transporter TatT component family protein n=1 Tax=Leptospira sp. GIMC2001 TaxID=1513297 RepID=UPI00234BA272|nr:TRAP transporter TatT component family protein [Leptospira sp. GIMC2001]WCL49906.1 TRAP transporter TatT component family protein [Leptospira sp. GIMC2001]